MSAVVAVWNSAENRYIVHRDPLTLVGAVEPASYCSHHRVPFQTANGMIGWIGWSALLELLAFRWVPRVKAAQVTADWAAYLIEDYMEGRSLKSSKDEKDMIFAIAVVFLRFDTWGGVKLCGPEVVDWVAIRLRPLDHLRRIQLAQMMVGERKGTSMVMRLAIYCF